jgi:hypothetical protein
VQRYRAVNAAGLSVMISETWYKAIAAAPERPASGNQCERIRKLIALASR